MDTGWLVPLLLYSLVPYGNTQDETLYFTCPGEKDFYDQVTRVPGLYGGQLGLADNGKGRDLFESGYHCAEHTVDRETVEFDKLEINGLSYDAASRQVLLSVKDKGHVTVVRGPLCSDVQICRNTTLEPVFFQSKITGRVSAFSQYQEDIYFVYTHDNRVNRRTSKQTVELRRLGCEEDFPFDKRRMFDLASCSTLLAVLHSEEFQSNAPVTPPSSLAIVKGADGGLVFFTQLLHLTKVDTKLQVNMKLLQVTVNEKKDSPPEADLREVKREMIRREFIQYTLNNIGAVALRGEKLCWSAVDVIYCGRWDGRRVSEETLVLPKGGAKEICKAPGERLLADVVTGIAIADPALDRHRLYFGCIATIPSAGGAALLDVSADRPRTIVPISSNHTGSEKPVFAGSMFLGDGCVHGYGPVYGHVTSGAGRKPFDFLACALCLLFALLK